MFVYRNIAPEIFDCRNKVNKSTLLKTYVEQALIFFHNYHKQLQVNILCITFVNYFFNLRNIEHYFYKKLIVLTSIMFFFANAFPSKFAI